MAPCKSQDMMRVMKITVPVLLIIHVLIGSTVIYLIVKRGNYPLTPTMDTHEMFRLSLEKAYHDANGGQHISLKKTQKPKRTTPSMEFLSLLKPVVHFSGLDFHQPVIGDERKMNPIRNWAESEGSERNLKYNGMTYENGRIIVPTTGVYFIYSHVKFYVENNKQEEEQDVFSHGIFRYNALTMTEGVVLSNTVTECKEGINDGAHLEYPSDIRGVVHLNAGDHVTVKVSDFNLLKHDRDWHYVGAYLV